MGTVRHSRVHRNVGIGTAAPSAKLDLAVSGNIRIKDWTLAVPDTVFEQDYRLPDLDEVRAYVDRNRHLPDIPSAAEVH